MIKNNKIRDMIFPPIGVKHKDWSRQQFLRFAGVLLIIFGIIGSLGIVTLAGSVYKNKQIKQLTLYEALNYRGNTLDEVAITGKIISDDTIRMPDTKEKIIKGKVRLSLKSLSTNKEQILIDWYGKAKFIKLVEGNYTLPVEISYFMIETLPDDRFLAKYDFSKPEMYSDPVQIEYYKRKFTVNPQLWNDTVVQNVKREYLLDGENVVLIAGLKNGGKITEPLTGRLRIVIPKNEIVNVNNPSGSNILWLILMALSVLSGGFIYWLGLSLKSKLLKYSESILTYHLSEKI